MCNWETQLKRAQPHCCSFLFRQERRNNKQGKIDLVTNIFGIFIVVYSVETIYVVWGSENRSFLCVRCFRSLPTWQWGARTRKTRTTLTNPDRLNVVRCFLLLCWVYASAYTGFCSTVDLVMPCRSHSIIVLVFRPIVYSISLEICAIR